MLGKFVCTFFLWEGQGFFLDKDQISTGEGKRKGWEGVWGRSLKWGLFLQNFHYSARYKLYLTNIWPDKLLITTIAIGMPKNLQAGTFKWLKAVLLGQKQLFKFCPQWHRQCKCHRWCRWHRHHRQCWWLQQGDWYSIAEGFQLC